MKILAFGDIHFHHTHRFSHITDNGFTVRELEHLQCADVIIDLCKEKQIDRIVFLGDMYSVVGDGLSGQTQTAVCEFISKISKVCPVDLLVGNHDFCAKSNCQGIHKLTPFKGWSNVTVYDMYSVVGDGLSGQTQTAVCEFISKISKVCPVDLLVGNHDFCAKSNCQGIHKLTPFKGWPNVTVYDMPTEVGNFIYMPYCDSDEYAETFLEAVQDKANKVVFSHLELKGLMVAAGFETVNGVALDTLYKFKKVLQGHYHAGGNKQNICIAGSTQRLSFKDPGRARKNILIYDTDTNELKRESFKCPDWLSYTDDNIEDVLELPVDNYVRLDITTDFLLTKEIKDKLNTMKGTDIHIDITRLSINKNTQVDIQSEDEIEVVTQFINKTTLDEDNKISLINEGKRLIESVKNA